MTWVYTLLGIMALIVLHELGHFAVAKAVGMRVERFSLFFPPKLVGFKRGETSYEIGLIPAGGYVKITGMSPEELKNLDLRIASRAYYMAAPWRRIAVILAGPGVNLLIAFLVFWAILFSGSLTGAGTLENLAPHVKTTAPSTAVFAIVKHQAADGLLRAGDRIVAVDGKPTTVESARRVIDEDRCAGPLRDGCRAATPLRLTVRRDGRDLSLSIIPRYSSSEHRMLLGVDFSSVPKHFGPFAAAWASLREMGGITAELVTNIGRAFTSSKVRHQLHSIVGITEVTQEAVAEGPAYGLVILGFVSLALAIINLFPFLPLDGGHVLWSVAEKLRGKRVSLTAMWRFSSVGIILLLFLVVNGFGNDIGRLGG